MNRKYNTEFWDSFAGKYDKFILKHANETYKKSINFIIEELSTDSNVLEIGTGTGLISFAIAGKVKNITAIDYAPEMIKLAKTKLENSGYNNIEFIESSATNIEQPGKSFDIIIASNVFHLLPEPDWVLQELIRLLADGGKIILPTYCHGQNLKSHIISFIMSLTGFKALNKWSIRQFREFVERAGLKIEKEEVIKDKIPLSFIVSSKQQSHG